MTDNEIIKALECCRQPAGSGSCNSCPFDYQRKKRLEEADKSCTDLMFGCVSDLINRLNSDKAALVKHLKKARRQLKTAKSEARKEFAERLKGAFCSMCEYDGGDIKDAVDNLLKEMG